MYLSNSGYETLTQYYYLIYRSYLNVASSPRNVFYSFCWCRIQSEWHVAFCCPVWVSSNPGQSLCLSFLILTFKKYLCHLLISEVVFAFGFADVSSWLDTGPAFSSGIPGHDVFCSCFTSGGPCGWVVPLLGCQLWLLCSGVLLDYSVGKLLSSHM